MSLLGVADANALASGCRQPVESALREGAMRREAHWTQSVAVGSKVFVADVQKRLWPRGNGRAVIEGESMSMLRESAAYYGDFDRKNAS